MVAPNKKPDMARDEIASTAAAIHDSFVAAVPEERGDSAAARRLQCEANEKRCALSKRLAFEFARRRGWRIGEKGFNLKMLAEGRRYYGRGMENYPYPQEGTGLIKPLAPGN